MSNVLSTIIEIVVLLAGFLCLKFVPNLNKGTINTSTEITTVTAALDCVSKAAYSFVIWAKNKMTTKTGNEKFDFVVKQVIKFCEDNQIEITEQQINAIVESSYEKMMQQIVSIEIETDKKENESEE